MKRWQLFLVGLGIGDLLTGLVLVARPASVLAPLGIAAPSPDTFLRWIGVFVAMVGFATISPAFERDPAERSARLRAATVWTAQVRVAVSAFVAVAVLRGALPIGFAIVGGWDAIAAAAQTTGARRWERDASH